MGDFVLVPVPDLSLAASVEVLQREILALEEAEERAQRLLAQRQALAAQACLRARRRLLREIRGRKGEK